MQILQTDLHTFPSKISWENLILTDQRFFPFVIILLILIDFALDNLWILLGENWCWSLLGLKTTWPIQSVIAFKFVWPEGRSKETDTSGRDLSLPFPEQLKIQAAFWLDGAGRQLFYILLNEPQRVSSNVTLDKCNIEKMLNSNTSNVTKLFETWNP